MKMPAAKNAKKGYQSKQMVKSSVPGSRTTSKTTPFVATETEGTFINKSLSTLGRIFKMLADRSAGSRQALPYRECKLTRILQDSLNFQSKTVMIVNVCSEFRSIRQTKESLSFAS